MRGVSIPVDKVRAETYILVSPIKGVVSIPVDKVRA